MHFVYHPKQEEKIVPTEEYKFLLTQGWYDTPAKFPKEMQKKRNVLRESFHTEDKELISSNDSEEFEIKKGRGRPPKIKDNIE